MYYRKNKRIWEEYMARVANARQRGVDIDDISDYGKYLGPKNHPDRVIQQEVLLENGIFKINDIKIIDKGTYNEYLIILEEY